MFTWEKKIRTVGRRFCYYFFLETRCKLIVSIPCDNEGVSCRGLGTVKLGVQAENLAHVEMFWNSPTEMRAFRHLFREDGTCHIEAEWFHTPGE